MNDTPQSEKKPAGPAAQTAHGEGSVKPPPSRPDGLTVLGYGVVTPPPDQPADDEDEDEE